MAMTTPNGPARSALRGVVPAALVLTALVCGAILAQTQALPNKPNSVKFAAIGDNGNGSQEQRDVGNQMVKSRAAFPFDFGALRRLSVPYALALVRIGLPLSLMGLLFSAVYVVLARIAARFGTEGLAVLGIGNRIESIAYLVATPLSGGWDPRFTIRIQRRF